MLHRAPHGAIKPREHVNSDEKDCKAGLEIKVRLGYMRPHLQEKYRKEICTPLASAAFFSQVLLLLEEDGARTREKTADLLAQL